MGKYINIAFNTYILEQWELLLMENFDKIIKYVTIYVTLYSFPVYFIYLSWPSVN